MVYWCTPGTVYSMVYSWNEILWRWLTCWRRKYLLQVGSTCRRATTSAYSGRNGSQRQRRHCRAHISHYPACCFAANPNPARVLIAANGVRDASAKCATSGVILLRSRCAFSPLRHARVCLAANGVRLLSLAWAASFDNAPGGIVPKWTGVAEKKINRQMKSFLYR